jgi:hypothetical protein
MSVFNSLACFIGTIRLCRVLRDPPNCPMRSFKQGRNASWVARTNISLNGSKMLLKTFNFRNLFDYFKEHISFIRSPNFNSVSAILCNIDHLIESNQNFCVSKTVTFRSSFMNEIFNQENLIKTIIELQQSIDRSYSEENLICSPHGNLQTRY